MEKLIAIYLWTLSLFILGRLIYDYTKKRRDLLTIRNIFLTGFVIFQPSSGAFSLWTGDWGQYPVMERGMSGLLFAVFCTGFYMVFEAIYRHLPGPPTLSRVFAAPRAQFKDQGLLALAIALGIIGTLGLIFFRKGAIAIIGSYTAMGFKTAAAVLAGWVMIKRIKNPVFVAICIGLLLMLIVPHLRQFSRRPILSLGAAVVWGMYYAQFRYLPPKQAMKRLTIVCVIPVLLVLFVTGLRTSSQRNTSLSKRMESLVSLSWVAPGVSKILDGQHTAAGSMWAMEVFPEEHEQRHLFQVKYFLVYAVPRNLWPNKPSALSQDVPDMLRVRAPDNYTLPPGVIGYGAAEGGIYAMFVYAMLLGMYCRLFDEYLTTHGNLPLVIAPLGAGLGHIMGIARGEPSQFAFLYLLTIAGVWLSLTIVGSMLSRANEQVFVMVPMDASTSYAEDV